MGTSSCHTINMTGGTGESDEAALQLLILRQWQGFSPMPAGNMDPASQSDQPIPGQRLGIDIPTYLVQTYRTGTRCMLAPSFQYSVLNRSYQKTTRGEHRSSESFPHISSIWLLLSYISFYNKPAIHLHLLILPASKLLSEKLKIMSTEGSSS